MPVDIRTVELSEFDLSMMEMRIMNYGQALKTERSMAVFGQLQPVVARLNNGRYQLIDGFKRLYAAEILLINTLECQVLDISLVQAKILLMSYNRSRRTMGFWEEALILQDLTKTHGMDQKQLARLIGRSRSWVSRRLSLIGKIDPEVAADFRMGEMTASHGRTLMKLPRGNQAAVAHAIMSRKLSTRQSDELVQAWLNTEDTDQRAYILKNPEVVLNHKWDNKESPYDVRLSCFGNELNLFAGQIVEAIHFILPLLTDNSMRKLNQSEKVIIIPYLQRVSKDCQKFSEAVSHLQTLQQAPEHEK